MEVKEEEKKNRRDLTKEMIFTIDGDDTRDIDDAVSIKRKENGNYVLGVLLPMFPIMSKKEVLLIRKRWSEELLSI